jgi:hypothetical protein
MVNAFYSKCLVLYDALATRWRAAAMARSVSDSLPSSFGSTEENQHGECPDQAKPEEP